jgi:hypothetical protein
MYNTGMGCWHIDSHSVLLLLILGNVVSISLFYVYFRGSRRVLFDNCFFASRWLQIAAWLLIMERGQIANSLSLQLGNALLASGFALEVMAIAFIKLRFSTTTLWALAGPLALTVLNFGIPGRSGNQMLGVGSLIFSFLYAASGYFLLFDRARPTALQRWLGVLYTVSFLGFIGRGLYLLTGLSSAAAPAEIVQILTLYLFFILMIIGTIGFILFKKELVDAQRETALADLQRALQQVKTLRGLLPICAACHKVRNDQGYWETLDDFIRSNSEADFTTDLCPDCQAKPGG